MLKKIIKNIYIFIFAFIILFPNGGSYYFNGMPLNGYLENIFFIVLLLFLILTKNFIINKITKILIVFTFIIKIFLIFIPPLGINYNQYFDDKKVVIKTYDTLWSKGYSSIQRFPWLKNSNFPLTMMLKVLNKSESKYICTFSSVSVSLNSLNSSAVIPTQHD
jgi:hypothetical protein